MVQDYCIPNDIITNYTIVPSSLTNNSVLVDDNNIFFLNHKKPELSICRVKILRAYIANEDLQWENLLPSTIPTDNDLELVFTRRNDGRSLNGKGNSLNIEHNNVDDGDQDKNSSNDNDEGKTVISVDVYSKFESYYHFELDEHNEYTIQEEANDENNHESFVSLFSSSNQSLGFSFYEEEEYKLRDWLFQNNSQNYDQQIDPQTDSQLNSSTDTPFLHGISVMRSKREDSKVSIHALVIISDYPFIYSFKSLLRYCLNHLLSGESLEDSPQFLLSELYESLSSFNLSDIPELDRIQQRIYRWTLLDSDTITYTAKLEFRNKIFKMRIPLSRDPDEIPDEQVSLVKLLSKFRNETMTIFNAIMEERRVLFFGTGGDKQSISSICFSVLSSCLLISPTFTNILEYKVYPYNTMRDLAFTNNKSYIAGMKHPDSKYKVNWDILCDCVSGKVIVNPESPYYQEMHSPKSHDKVDHGFICSMLSLIDSYALKGYKLETLETSIRVHFQEYSKRLANMSCGTIEFEDQEKKHNSHAMNEERLTKWKSTQSFQIYKRKTIHDNQFVKSISLENLVHKLRTYEFMNSIQIEEILTLFLQHITVEEEVLEFITYFPDPQGGLYPLAVLLLHSDSNIRKLTVTLLSRIDQVPEGSACISCLNTFLMLSFDRLKDELNLN